MPRRGVVAGRGGVELLLRASTSWVRFPAGAKRFNGTEKVSHESASQAHVHGHDRETHRPLSGRGGGGRAHLKRRTVLVWVYRLVCPPVVTPLMEWFHRSIVLPNPSRLGMVRSTALGVHANDECGRIDAGVVA